MKSWKSILNKIVVIALLTLLVLTGCTSDTNEGNEAKGNETEQTESTDTQGNKTSGENTKSDEKETIYSSEKAKEIIEDKATKVLESLKNFDTDKLAEYTHPEKGLRFSPYTYIEDTDLVFNKEEVANLNDENKEYMWGTYDGSGFDISLTPKEYFNEFVYDKDYLKESIEVGYNEVISTSQTIGNQYEVYKNPIVVEYFYKGTESASYFDWKSLRLVFEEFKGQWYLVGIIHSEKTI